jgi:hypothetical protein
MSLDQGDGPSVCGCTLETQEGSKPPYMWVIYDAFGDTDRICRFGKRSSARQIEPIHKWVGNGT